MVDQKCEEYVYEVAWKNECSLRHCGESQRSNSVIREHAVAD